MEGELLYPYSPISASLEVPERGGGERCAACFVYRPLGGASGGSWWLCGKPGGFIRDHDRIMKIASYTMTINIYDANKREK